KSTYVGRPGGLAAAPFVGKCGVVSQLVITDFLDASASGLRTVAGTTFTVRIYNPLTNYEITTYSVNPAQGTGSNSDYTVSYTPTIAALYLVSVFQYGLTQTTEGDKTLTISSGLADNSKSFAIGLPVIVVAGVTTRF